MKHSIYQMPEKPKGGPKSIYPADFRKQVAEEYLTSNLSLSQIQERFSLPKRSVAVSFVNWYKANFDLSAIKIDVTKNDDSKGLINQERVNELEKMLQLAKLKIESLETMIDIAEGTFQIDIRKKSGAKQSKK